LYEDLEGSFVGAISNGNLNIPPWIPASLCNFQSKSKIIANLNDRCIKTTE